MMSNAHQPRRNRGARSKNANRKRRLSIESLELRRLLIADSISVEFENAFESVDQPIDARAVPLAMEAMDEVAPQYVVNQPPRLQLGNAPLIRTPEYVGMDQVELLWQTQTIDEGTDDRFSVEFLELNRDQDEPWQIATLNTVIDTEVENRLVHSATLDELFWNTTYDYRVHHWRGEQILQTFDGQFKTRLRPGNRESFSFAAYGDSSTPSHIEDFRAVQAEITRRDLDFSLLLGDAIYEFGQHHEADFRFNPELNPEAADWVASHIDYLGFGNHDALQIAGHYPAEENYSNPIPQAKVNAHASAPSVDRAERTYSFDYGMAHFISFDTTDLDSGSATSVERLKARLDYAVADLQESLAAWKIAFVHLPIAGTEKPTSPNSAYFQQVVSRFNEVGVDLILVGDSHTYSWTYPLQGVDDANSDGLISADEVVFSSNDSRAYSQGDGLIQVVSGVGGHSLRSHDYPDPFIASAYTKSELTGPIEYGFAEVQVTESELTISYIASNGRIVGDTNDNGQPDSDEPWFGQFTISRGLPDVEPQYNIQHPPRVQPGNAPLVGTPAFTGQDQIDILWQTARAGNGTDDGFQVEYRLVGSESWQNAPLNSILDTKINGRLNHSVSIENLEWNSIYEYRVHHLRADSVLQTFKNTFKTRLAPGDSTPFTFVSYGDSSVKRPSGDEYQRVQTTITREDPDFALLLGDNFYDFGSQVDSDGRFHADDSPASSYWTSGHVEYFSIGNHDVLNLDGGQTSRDNFSVPIPVAGVNAYAQPSDEEHSEFTFSFDYGDVHFVTWDSNIVEIKSEEEFKRRMNAQADYLVADLMASDATWKIVYMHHPMTGADKVYQSGYFTTLWPKLQAAGVDLVMNGDSHTYAWTYPITGLVDKNADGLVLGDEVEFVAGDPRRFDKGSGMIQLIAGVGGRSKRDDGFADPYFAAAYSQAASTFPLEFGYAKLDVSPHELLVTYISSTDGSIVGDFNHNGVLDNGEDYFGQFRIVADLRVPGDVNRDGLANVEDIDRVCQAIRANETDAAFDLDSNGRVDLQDHRFLILDILGTNIGDANLDGIVNSLDLIQIFQISQYEDDIPGNSTWASGDWNCDGEFNTADLVLLFQTGAYEP